MLWGDARVRVRIYEQISSYKVSDSTGEIIYRFLKNLFFLRRARAKANMVRPIWARLPLCYYTRCPHFLPTLAAHPVTYYCPTVLLWLEIFVQFISCRHSVLALCRAALSNSYEGFCACAILCKGRHARMRSQSAAAANATLRRCDLDLNEHVRVSQASLGTDARWLIVRAYPCVPYGIHTGIIFGNITQPYSRFDELRFRGACFGKQCIDFGQSLQCLLGYIRVGKRLFGSNLPCKVYDTRIFYYLGASGIICPETGDRYKTCGTDQVT
jgi:hypothetical protein